MPKRKAPERVSGLDRLVSERVIQAREIAGLNKRELAERLGLAESSYSPYENLKIAYTVDMIDRLARILGRPIEYFLGLDAGLTEDEGQLLALYRSLPHAEARAMILRIIRSAAQEG